MTAAVSHDMSLRSAALVAGLTLVLCIATGCPAPGALPAVPPIEERPAGDDGRLAAVGIHSVGYPIVDRTVTVNALIQRPGHVPTAFDEQTLVAEMQERANIDIVFDEVPSAQVQEKTSLVFASREFPDVIFVAGISDRLLWDAARAGDVWPLGALTDRYAPNWKRAFEERPVIRKAITLPDGKIYSLPYYREILNDFGIRDIQAINVDWLDALGLEMPATTEELYQTLRAFRQGIDDGTLPADGIPWYFRYHSWGGGEWEVYNAFGLWMKGQGVGAEKYLSVNNGVVEFGATDDKLKDAVNYLHRLFSHGLIPDEVFTDAWGDYLAKTRSVPPVAGLWGSYFVVAAVEEWYDPLPPVAGPTGVQRFRSQPVRLQRSAFTLFGNFELPEVMLRFIDAWADDDFSVRASYGGPTLEHGADGTRTVLGTGTDWFNHGPHNHFPLLHLQACVGCGSLDRRARQPRPVHQGDVRLLHLAAGTTLRLYQLQRRGKGGDLHPAVRDRRLCEQRHCGLDRERQRRRRVGRLPEAVEPPRSAQGDGDLPSVLRPLVRQLTGNQHAAMCAARALARAGTFAWRPCGERLPGPGGCRPPAPAPI